MISAFGVDHNIVKYARMVKPDQHTDKWSSPEPIHREGPVYNKAKADEWRKSGYLVSERVHANGKTAYARQGVYPNKTVRRGLLRRKTTTADLSQVQYEMSKSDWGEDVDPKLPMYAIHRGKKKLILGMHNKDVFKLDEGDGSVRHAHRSEITAFVSRAQEAKRLK